MKKIFYLVTLVAISLLFVQCKEKHNEEYNGHEYVDLGLPSGTKWATCNVGANSPEEYGDYFAWGEVESKTDYSWSTYKHGSAKDKLTKYCNNSNAGKYGFTDKKNVLDQEDDVATINWGGSWRMPTAEEQKELIDNCVWTYTTQKGVDGYKVKGPNGNSIFLPSAGYMGNSVLDNAGVFGFYWSSSLSLGTSNPFPEDAYNMCFGLSFKDITCYSRDHGRSVRPVLSNELIAETEHNNEEDHIEDDSDYSIEDEKAIDLGLPSGIKWAICNVGANSPEEYGDYFAWGETEPKTTYNLSTYKYGTDLNQLTKYCSNSIYGKDGFTDNKRTLDPKDDAATVNWGNHWRMPTEEEQNELLNNCKWIRGRLNGVQGYKVVGPNGNSIFLPAAGEMTNNSLNYAGSTGCYWLGALDTSNPNGAYILHFYSSGGRGLSKFGRSLGRTIRPVFSNKLLTEAEYTEEDNYIEEEDNYIEEDDDYILEEDHIEDDGDYSLKEVKAIDLGLPSGIKWATCNIGANTPEESGDYFAWGEIYPKTSYCFFFYTHGSSFNELTKYCLSSRYCEECFIDNKTVLDLKDDAAAVNWGGDWRMPTSAELDELRANCTWIWFTQNGVNGYKVTGPNGNSIFFPAAGYMSIDRLCRTGVAGYYWSSSLNTYHSDCALFLDFAFEYVKEGNNARCNGHSVRPVCP